MWHFTVFDEKTVFILILHFLPSLHFVPGLQPAVCSLHFVLTAI